MRKNIRSGLSLLLAGIMTAGMLTGCGDNDLIVVMPCRNRDRLAGRLCRVILPFPVRRGCIFISSSIFICLAINSAVCRL